MIVGFIHEPILLHNSSFFKNILVLRQPAER